MTNYRDLITYLTNHLGYNVYYSINVSKIEQELGWKLQDSFKSGIH